MNIKRIQKKMNIEMNLKFISLILYKNCVIIYVDNKKECVNEKLIF